MPREGRRKPAGGPRCPLLRTPRGIVNPPARLVTVARRIHRGQGVQAPAPPSRNLGPCPNPQRRRINLLIPPKWHGSASRGATWSDYRPGGEAGRITVPPFPAATASKLVIGLSGSGVGQNRPMGGRGTAQIPATNPQLSIDVLAAGIRILPRAAAGPSPCKSFGGANYGEYAELSGHRTSWIGRRPLGGPWPVAGGWPPPRPRRSSRPTLAAALRPPLKPAESPVTGIRGGLTERQLAHTYKKGPPEYRHLTGPATERSPVGQPRECVGRASCPTHAESRRLDPGHPTGFPPACQPPLARLPCTRIVPTEEHREAPRLASPQVP